MQDVLLEDVIPLEAGPSPCYDKDPGVPSYVIGNDDAVLRIDTPHRVFVPMHETTDDVKKTLALVKAVAQSNESLEYEDSFLPIRSYFDRLDLPLGVVIKNPEARVDVPSNVEVVDHEDVEDDRFYCLTRAELLGRRPRVPGMIISGVQCPDRLGFLIFNPKGILTVMLDPSPRVVKIPNHS